jgi:hypothetical protein
VRVFGKFMIGDPEPVASALRSTSGVKDVDVVQFALGKELWVVLKDPINIDRLRRVSESLGYIVTRRTPLTSKLPRSLAEMVWDGVTYVVTKHTHVPGRQEWSARVMKNLVTGDMIYHVMDADGLEILKEYLKT